MPTERELVMGDTILTPILSQEQAEEDTSCKVKMEFDILREPSAEKLVRRLNQLSDQWRETVGGIVTQNTISGVIFYQLIKRAVAVSNEAENNIEDDTTWENSEENSVLDSENIEEWHSETE